VNYDFIYNHMVYYEIYLCIIMIVIDI